MTGYVQTLDRVRATDIASVGGKGANLGELVAAGVPVPPAFCVTTDAYRSFLETSGLSERMAALLDRIDYDDPAGIEHSASAIRALFLGEPTPPVIAEEITTAYRDLESSLGLDVSVSVRSSATAEDLPGKSFAGQQDTFLFVSGAERVVDAVKRCWASLWTDRAIAYRHTHGFDHERVWLAVVVQEMFPSEVSGILFTANPVTSNPDEHFLNLSWGLGEAIVSGRVNPDQLVVAKGSAEIVERTVADKELMTIRHPCGHGSVEAPVPDELREIQALADEHVRELCAIGQRIEDHYGFPQDIEWGWAGGRFAILQAREITGANLDFALGLELVEDAGGAGLDVRRALGLVEGLLRRGADRPVDAVVLHLPAARHDPPQGGRADHDRHLDLPRATRRSPSSISRSSGGTAPAPTTTLPSSGSASDGSSRRSPATRPRSGPSRRRSARRSGTCPSTGTSSSDCFATCTPPRPTSRCSVRRR